MYKEKKLDPDTASKAIEALLRKNPKYPPWHCMTVVECPKCGESYEPICELKHICKKQNSYPERTVFLTRDEAERALKEREKNADD